jgi:hypothetical protein
MLRASSSWISAGSSTPGFVARQRSGPSPLLMVVSGMASMTVVPMRTSFTWRALMRFLISLYGTVLARAGAKNWFSSTRPKKSASSGRIEKRGGRGPGLLRRSRLDLRRSVKLGSAMPPAGANSGPCAGEGVKG